MNFSTIFLFYKGIILRESLWTRRRQAPGHGGRLRAEGEGIQGGKGQAGLDDRQRRMDGGRPDVRGRQGAKSGTEGT